MVPMVTFPSQRSEPSLASERKAPPGGNWGRDACQATGMGTRSNGGWMSNDGLGSGVDQRGSMGGPTQLVVQLPGYCEVICDPTPAMRELFTARLRGEYAGTPAEFASEFHMMMQQDQ